MAMPNWISPAVQGPTEAAPLAGLRPKLPQAKAAVANSTSQGTSCSKKLLGVSKSSAAPTAPPTRLMRTGAPKATLAPPPLPAALSFPADDNSGTNFACHGRPGGGQCGRFRQPEEYSLMDSAPSWTSVSLLGKLRTDPGNQEAWRDFVQR